MIELICVTNSNDSNKVILNLVKELKCACECFMDIEPITLNRLEGYYTIYRTKDNEFYKALVRNPTNCLDECLSVVIKVLSTSVDIKEVMNYSSVKSFFCDLRAE